MRVIAGKYRGRRLAGPKHSGLRPTADRVKEALFNILGARIEDAAFLDLFSGTGSIAIEALSRGAGRVVLTDKNQASIKLIRENMKFIDATDQIRLLHLPAQRALEILGKECETFDIIFLDPPFEGGLLPEIVASIQRNRLLKQDGVLVMEHPHKLDLTDYDFPNRDTRVYGDISLTFFMVK